MDKIKFKIITPERVVFSEDVDSVTMVAQDGEITVLPHHISLVTILRAGELKYKKDGEEMAVSVSGGFAEVRADNTLIILADTAEQAHEIDIARAEAAKARAEKLMSEERKFDDVEYATLQSNMEKALNRLRVGNKYRKIKKQLN